MTKGTKIVIGISLFLALAGLTTYIIYKIKNKPPTDEEDWDIDVDGGSKKTIKNSNGTTVLVSDPVDEATRKMNNFEAVKKYFGNSATIYNDRVVLTKTASEIATSLNKTVNEIGLTNEKVSAVFWDNGQFTVKIGDTQAVLSGYYYQGGTVIKISSGKGVFASKKGRIEEGVNVVNNIARLFAK